jgi:hypothetical protein
MTIELEKNLIQSGMKLGFMDMVEKINQKSKKVETDNLIFRATQIYK